MQLIVGLGNPGPSYEGTRHNVGFAVLDELALRCGASSWRKKGKAEVTQASFAGRSVHLAKPQTFMNLSGDSVVALASFYKIAIGDILVIHDELDFPLGRVRLKVSGGHGGHNGLRSIIAHLGPDFARLRLGIGRPRHQAADADFVLSKFASADRQTVADAVAWAADATELVCDVGLTRATERVNRHDV